MAVHDDGSYNHGPLQPGHVFSIDPQLRVPEENLYIRYEDVIVTENGWKVSLIFCPPNSAKWKKLVRTGGVVQKAPPVPLSAIPSKR